LFGKLSLYSIGDFNVLFIRIALHGEAAGVGPLARAVVIGIESNVEELTGGILVFTSHRPEFEGIDAGERV